MLKGLDGRLTPDLLHMIASMGHGDTVTICDANFPAASVARQTVVARPLRMACNAPDAVRVILGVMPIDTYEPDMPPVETMQVVDEPGATPPAVAEAMPLFEREQVRTVALDRFAFYEAARRSFAVVLTDEFRPYGNFILRRGVIF